jgi:hypothetical protein
MRGKIEHVTFEIRQCRVPRFMRGKVDNAGSRVASVEGLRSDRGNVDARRIREPRVWFLARFGSLIPEARQKNQLEKRVRLEQARRPLV